MVAEVVSVAVEDRHQQAACFTTAPDTGHHRSLSHVFYLLALGLSRSHARS
jgi:hypothetical protein